MGKDKSPQSSSGITQAEMDALLKLMDGDQTSQHDKSAPAEGTGFAQEANNSASQTELDGLLAETEDKIAPSKAEGEPGSHGAGDKGSGKSDKVLSQDEIDALLAAMNVH